MQLRASRKGSVGRGLVGKVVMAVVIMKERKADCEILACRAK